MGRILRAWGALEGEQRLAAIASLALFVTMFLPWYQLTSRTSKGLDSTSLSAFGDFSWVEAAVLLVALGVLGLLFLRAERRAFHLPGGDGTVILAAGAWVTLLLIWRAFDKPGGNDVTAVGLEWGFVFGFAAAGALAYAGFRLRAAHLPEPPLPGDAPPDTPPGRPPADAPAAAGHPLPRRPRRARPDSRATVADAETQLAMPLAGDEPGPERRQPPAPGGDLDHTAPHGSELPLPRDDLTAELEPERRRG